jgi:hypothetical protein
MQIFPTPFSLSRLNYYKPNRNVLDLFWSSAARTVSQTFIVLFSSVYVYQSFTDMGFIYKSSLLLVCLFYFLMISSKLTFLIIAENLSRKTGFKGMIWLSAVPYIFFIPFMIYGSINPLFFFIAGVFYGVHSAFYWWGYHGFFVKAGDKGHFGGGLGRVELINTSAVVLTPIIGGIFIKTFGFSSSYVVASLFMFLSLILLGRGNDKRQKRDVRFIEVINIIKSHKTISLAYIGSGMEGTFYLVAWPLFLLLFFGEIVSLGTFIGASMFLAAILSVFIGDQIDKQGERGVVAISSPLLSFSWLLKSVNSLTPNLILAETIRNFGEKTLSISLLDLTYRKAQEAETAKAILFREITVIIGTYVCLLLILISAVININLQGVFVIIALASLLPLIFVYKKRIN